MGLRGAPRGPVSIAACVPSSFLHLLLPSTGLILGHDEWKNNKSRKGGGEMMELLWVHFDCARFIICLQARVVPHLFGKVPLNINES